MDYLGSVLRGSWDNQTRVSGFTLLGLSSDWHTQVALFILFLAMYLLTVAGNFLILVLIGLDSRLHTPMYFFLSVLSLVDISYTNSTVPQMLSHFLSSRKSISFRSCVLQLFVSLAMGSTEFFLLGTMAYDRYVAVCHPLRYRIIMHGGLCLGLAAGCLVAGFTNSLMQTIFIFQLPLCHSVINHFACEMLAVLRLACVDISFNKVMVALSGFLVIMLPCVLVLFSYARIVAAILHIRSSQGRSKAFGTCTSHLTVVSLCFGTAIFTYMRPVGGSAAQQEKMVALFYAIVTPMLNPLIYSLRNKDVIGALQKVLGKFSKTG
ncbi:olfactory receptor-like protein OLF3 [Octodon degus]|uniref:Olfactory receptor n=1 Tax=Octodon degus TaxID=10160 RepID=A0A6P3F488_OCTDE|nr:olfactory receptor-like protein OLF3 [Octodon degus]